MGRAAVIALWLVAGCHAVPAGERCYGDDCAFGLVCASHQQSVGCEDMLPKVCRRTCTADGGASQCGSCTCVEGCGGQWICATSDGAGECPP